MMSTMRSKTSQQGLLEEVTKDIEKEPMLQPLMGEFMRMRTLAFTALSILSARSFNLAAFPASLASSLKNHRI